MLVPVVRNESGVGMSLYFEYTLDGGTLHLKLKGSA
jgi:hypothetical protein